MPRGHATSAFVDVGVGFVDRAADVGAKAIYKTSYRHINPLNHELNPICYLLALLGAHHFLHVSRIRVKSLTFGD